MVVVTPTDRLKSVRNRCVIELFVALFVFLTLPFRHFCWCRGFCHRTESDLLLFLLMKWSTISIYFIYIGTSFILFSAYYISKQLTQFRFIKKSLEVYVTILYIVYNNGISSVIFKVKLINFSVNSGCTCVWVMRII